MAVKRSTKAKSKPSRQPSKFKRAMRFIWKGIVFFLAASFLWVFLLRFVNPPVTWLMLQRGFERKADGEDWKMVKKWKDFDELSNNLKIAAMAGEDSRFLQHWGFDLNAIEKAYQKNQMGTKVRGGSTISQQTAKNVFLWPGRSWIRKGFEAYFTILIELLWSKERILEVYLNVMETGDGLYGAEAATQYYFDKPSNSLSKSQAALLIAVLPNPRRWTPARPTAYIYRKQSLILRNMYRLRNVKFD